MYEIEETVGKLTILELVLRQYTTPSTKNKARIPYLKCRCECGNIAEYKYYDVKNRTRTECTECKRAKAVRKATMTYDQKLDYQRARYNEAKSLVAIRKVKNIYQKVSTAFREVHYNIGKGTVEEVIDKEVLV
jgi:hypothetical protein